MTEPVDFRQALNRAIRGTLDPNPAPPPSALSARKVVVKVWASCCELTDGTGENHCTHPSYTYPPVPRLRRWKWKVRSWWSDLRMQLGSWIAGTNLEDE